MKPRSFILRFAALFFMLIFLQKTGAGLILHNLLHTNKQTADTAQQDNSNTEASYACNCLNDFLTPFVDADEPVIFAVIEKPVAEVEFFSWYIPFYSPVFSSLRGPPASSL
jgi:hypothetical protein